MNTTAPQSDDVQVAPQQPSSQTSGSSLPPRDQNIQQQPQGGTPATGSPGKEYEPGQSFSEYASLPGAELEPDLSREVKDLGVEVSPNTDRPKLTVEDKRLGIQHGVDALSHPTTIAGGKQLPMTKAEATVVLENRQIKIWDSVKWFAKNIFRQHEKKEMEH